MFDLRDLDVNPAPIAVTRTRLEKRLRGRHGGVACDDPHCPGWCISDAGRGDEIERCDNCTHDVPGPICDEDVTLLPEAQVALARAYADAYDNEALFNRAFKDALLDSLHADYRPADPESVTTEEREREEQRLRDKIVLWTCEVTGNPWADRRTDDTEQRMSVAWLIARIHRDAQKALAIMPSEGREPFIEEAALKAAAVGRGGAVNLPGGVHVYVLSSAEEARLEIRRHRRRLLAMPPGPIFAEASGDTVEKLGYSLDALGEILGALGIHPSGSTMSYERPDYAVTLTQGVPQALREIGHLKAKILAHTRKETP
jgi:hypothetical protein